MDYQKLELHIALVKKVVKECRKKFKDRRRQKIYRNLREILKKIEKCPYQEYDIGTLSSLKKALNIIFAGVVSLNYKREKDLPVELIYCLNKVLADWIIDAENEFFLTISYNNSIDQFSSTTRDQSFLQNFDLFLRTKLNVGYKQALIHISKPSFLVDDFLSSVPVYHELGHFIDHNYQIVDDIFNDKAYLPDLIGEEREKKIKKYYAEFFADIFAAQYTGQAGVEILSYIAHGQADLHSHPSTESRIKVITAFLLDSGDNETMSIIKKLKDATIARTKRLVLKFRNPPLSENPFVTGKAAVLDKNTGMVHTLISEGWNQWKDRSKPIHQIYTDSIICCEKINKLIKESIRKTMES